MKFSYRYYVRRSPFITRGQYTEHLWSVYLGEKDGPNVSCYSTHLFKTRARIRAWRLNRRRGFNTCGSKWYRRVPG